MKRHTLLPPGSHGLSMLLLAFILGSPRTALSPRKPPSSAPESRPGCLRLECVFLSIECKYGSAMTHDAADCRTLYSAAHIPNQARLEDSTSKHENRDHNMQASRDVNHHSAYVQTLRMASYRSQSRRRCLRHEEYSAGEKENGSRHEVAWQWLRSYKLEDAIELSL